MKTALVHGSFLLAVSAVAQGAARNACGTLVGTSVRAQAPTAFVITLQDVNHAQIPRVKLTLTGVGNSAPKIAKGAVTDSQGVFRFDPVPAGDYAITILNTAWTGEKAHVQCAADNSCRVAFVLKSVSPHECYQANYEDEKYPAMRR